MDCNNNGVADLCDIASGFSADTNEDHIPDECQCLPNDVTNLTAARSGANIVLRWRATGDGSETYTVYRAIRPDAPFTGGEWEVLASALPSVPGPNAMSFIDTTGFSMGDRHFYVVTSTCP